MKAFIACLTILELLATPVSAALKPGDAAPDFTVKAAVGGKDFTFSLSEALKKGPVVLYFYPKSFTKGCTIEAHEFAAAATDFSAAGASLIGISKDNIETQRKFSTEACRNKFPVAADPNLSVIRAHHSIRTTPAASEETVADRISYVIAPDGKIIYAYSDQSPDKHIKNVLAAVRQWRAERAKGH